MRTELILGAVVVLRRWLPRARVPALKHGNARADVAQAHREIHAVVEVLGDCAAQANESCSLTLLVTGLAPVGRAYAFSATKATLRTRPSRSHLL